MMLIEVINKGSVLYFGSNNNNFTGVSLYDILFSIYVYKIYCLQCMWTEISFI